ncbi:hypothetical protein [Sphingomonas sp. BK235]|jgi:hypothetical protein|uniref:hypothetical protein n=1 Tax=Sphingomonas sp. BK235 TaxID=2512131 RepID=UPI0010445ED3|nr:hypothetical protein [Sphingomonas sp. BK235]TCP31060.1 hypothetical protein EV292_11166 [Sphingomonas sp. BK235]
MLDKVVFSGPAGYSLSVGPTSLDAPAWVQAVGSIAAILVAVWTVSDQRRQQENAAVERDAAFAEFIERFLKDIDGTIEAIASDIESAGRRGQLVQACEEALERFDRYIIQRFEKLRNMELKEWPDVEFASLFNEAFIGLDRQFKQLQLTATEQVAKQALEMEAVHNSRLAAAAAAARADEEDEEFLGDMDDGEVVVRTGGEDWGRLMRDAWRRRTGDEEEQRLLDHEQALRDEQRALEDDAARYAAAEWQEEKHTLYVELIQPLYDISNEWSGEASKLRRAIARYKELVPTGLSFEDRAKRRRYRKWWYVA